MSTLVYFLIWGGFFFVMMRFGCGAHIMGHSKNHRHSDEHQQNAPKTVAVTDTPSTRNREQNNEHQH